MERLNTANGCHVFTACHQQRPRESDQIDFTSPAAHAYRPALRYRCDLQGTTLHRPNGQLDLEPAECQLILQLDGTGTIADSIAWARSRLTLAPPLRSDPARRCWGCWSSCGGWTCCRSA